MFLSVKNQQNSHVTPQSLLRWQFNLELGFFKLLVLFIGWVGRAYCLSAYFYNCVSVVCVHPLAKAEERAKETPRV